MGVTLHVAYQGQLFALEPKRLSFYRFSPGTIAARRAEVLITTCEACWRALVGRAARAVEYYDPWTELGAPIAASRLRPALSC